MSKSSKRVIPPSQQGFYDKDRYIHQPYPAWTAIGISELAIPGGLVEIRVSARVGG